jgi:hypothetical protein
MKKRKFDARYFVPNVKIESQTDEATTFRVVGIPYGGPEWLDGKDLHNEKFDKTTDFGKNAAGEMVVKTIYAYYDHALNDSVGRDRIGYANFYQETDVGQIWDIEIQRAYRYHDMLLTMAQKGLLGASSQPVQTSVEIDYDTGLIKRWHPAEISLTPTPANPDAVVAIAKSFGFIMKDGDLEDETDPAEGDVDEDDEGDEGDEVVDPAQAIDDLFNDEEGEEGEEAAVLDLVKALKPVSDAITQLTTSMQEIVTRMDKQEIAQATANKGLMIGVQQLKTAQVRFAEHVATRLKLNIPKLDDRSDAEREADRLHAISPIPENAPGKRKVAGANGNHA